MSNLPEQQKKKLPALNDLYNDIELVSKQNELNILLNQQPKADWVKQHPVAKNVKYIPIEIVEYLLTSIFIRWKVEVKGLQVIANSVVATIRLHVQDPIDGEWLWQDGIGAAPIQTKSGAAATDFTQVLTDAVTKAAPAAESYAVKDAAEKLGKIFGKDLNRKEALPYTNLEGKIDLANVDCTDEHYSELWGLLKEASCRPEERENFADQIIQGMTVAEYQTLKRMLIDRQMSARTRLQMGETLSTKETVSAVKEAVQS